MSGLWHISAHLELVRDARRIHYKVKTVSEYAYPSLDNILYWCKIACEKLLSDLEQRKAMEKDIAHVKREIEFLESNQSEWKAKNKK